MSTEGRLCSPSHQLQGLSVPVKTGPNSGYETQTPQKGPASFVALWTDLQES